MDTKEKHIRENESNVRREEREAREGYLAPEQAEGLTARGKVRKNRNTGKVNRIWLWFGVLILIFILLWWLFSIGTFDALLGTANG